MNVRIPLLASLLIAATSAHALETQDCMKQATSVAAKGARLVWHGSKALFACGMILVPFMHEYDPAHGHLYEATVRIGIFATCCTALGDSYKGLKKEIPTAYQEKLSALEDTIKERAKEYCPYLCITKK